LAIGNFVKHYNTASSSITIQEIFKKGGHKSYAVYWLLIELLSQKFDGERVKIELHEQELVKHLRIRSDCLVKELQKSCNSYLSLSERVGSLFIFDAPILLDLLHRDYKKARTERGVSAPKNKDIRIKNKEVRDEVAEKYVAIDQESFHVPLKLMRDLQMLEGYPEKIITEVAKEAWILYNASNDSKKDWNRFSAAYFRNEKQKIRDRILNDPDEARERLIKKYEGSEYEF